MLFDSKRHNIIHIETDEPLPMFIVESQQWGDLIGISTSFAKIERGFGNGYVCLPKWHPYFKIPYDNILVNIHGGLTFGHYDETEDMWVIGFDTSHHGDNLENCPFEYVKEQCIYLQKQCLDLKEVQPILKVIKRILKLNKIRKIMKL